jgi:hypothetical protein
MVQSAADTVIVEQHGLAGFQAEGFGDAAAGPIRQGVQGLPGQQQIVQQHLQDYCRGYEGGTPRQRRKVPLEQAGQIEAVEQALQHWHGTDFQGLQTKAHGHSRGKHEDLTTNGRARVRGDRPPPRIGQGEKILAGLPGKSISPARIF